MIFDENKEKITHHVKLSAKNGKLNEMLDALEECARATRGQPGCEYYEIIQSIPDPSVVMLIIKYSNYAAFKENRTLPIVRNFIDNLQPQLAAEVSDNLYVTRVDSLGTRSQLNIEELSYRNEIRK
jgi:quinol monooxygenase YgiN